MNKKLIAASLTLSLTGASCMGTNNAFNSLMTWNADVSKENWLNEILFVGMVIIPVYQIALLGDVVVFNTAEYWTGENPIEPAREFPDTFTGVKPEEGAEGDADADSDE
jgi:Domain of unknown function (DUF3332)